MSERQTLELPFADPPVLELATGFSELELLPVEDGGTPRVETRRAPEDLGITAALEDGVTVLRLGLVEAPLRWLGPGHPTVRVYVPKQVRARVRNDMGTLSIRGLEGCDLDVTTSAGQLKLDTVHGRLKLHADAGEIKGVQVGGSLDVGCNAGSAKLSVDQLDPGEHRVFSNMGSVRIELAPEISVRIEAKTVMGATRVRFPSTADAKAVLRLDADLGSVKVSEAPAGDARHGDWADWRRTWAEQPWAARPEGSFTDGPPWVRWAETARNVVSKVFEPPRPPVRDDELKRILSMVEEGKINAAEAEKLIRAIEGR